VVIRLYQGRLATEVFESWNATTHVGTNPALLSQMSDFVAVDTIASIGYGHTWIDNTAAFIYCGSFYYTTRLGQLFLFVNPRWLALMARDPATNKTGSRIRYDVYGYHAFKYGYYGAQGCFEFSRDYPEDTAAAGYPCFYYLHTSWLSTLLAYSKNGTSWWWGETTDWRTHGYLPRTRKNNTGSAAYAEYSFPFGRTKSPTMLQSLLPTGVNPWNGNDWAFDLMLFDSQNTVTRGTVYGLKMFTPSRYMLLDRAVLNIDSDYLYVGKGSNADFHILTYGANWDQDNESIALPDRVLLPV
jgi:hypothetical protein